MKGEDECGVRIAECGLNGKRRMARGSLSSNPQSAFRNPQFLLRVHGTVMSSAVPRTRSGPPEVSVYCVYGELQRYWIGCSHASW